MQSALQMLFRDNWHRLISFQIYLFNLYISFTCKYFLANKDGENFSWLGQSHAIWKGLVIEWAFNNWLFDLDPIDSIAPARYRLV